MKVQLWIFTVLTASSDRPLGLRVAIVGSAQVSTVEAALRLAEIPETVCAEMRSCDLVRNFVDGRLDPEHWGYYHHDQVGGWGIRIGSVDDIQQEQKTL